MSEQRKIIINIVNINHDESFISGYINSLSFYLELNNNQNYNLNVIINNEICPIENFPQFRYSDFLNRNIFKWMVLNYNDSN